MEETGKKARKENGRKDGIVKGRLARDVQLNLLNSQIKKNKRTHTDRGQASSLKWILFACEREGGQMTSCVAIGQLQQSKIIN